MARILISAPSLDPACNVSGVAQVVRTIQETLGTAHEFRHLELGRKQRGGLAGLGALRRFVVAAAIVAGGDYDIFHSNTPADRRGLLRDVPLMCIARTRGRQCIWHVHGGILLARRARLPLRMAMRLGARVASRVILLSAHDRGHFRQGPGVEVVAIGVILPPRAAQPERNNALEAVFAGRLTPDKGIPALLAAAEMLEGSGIRIRVFGDGPLRETVRAAAARSGVLSYEGVVANAVLCDALTQADAVLLPSRHEGMPMVILEGMAAGAVPVCTAVGALRDNIVDGENGLVIAGDPASVAAALQRLAKDGALRQRLAVNAGAFAAEHADARLTFARLGEIYDELAPR